MNKQLAREYRRFREHSPFMLVGENAKLALQAAKTVIRFRRLEALGYVRLEAKPDDDYEWTDDAERERFGDDGAWGSVGEFTLALPGYEYPPHGPYWTHADSVWGHVGYKDVLSPYENCYIVDIMQATIDALRAAYRQRCQQCKGKGVTA